MARLIMSENGGNERNGIDKNRILPEIELDVGPPALLSDRESEEESDGDRGNWVEHALNTKQRVLSGDGARKDEEKKVSHRSQSIGELEVSSTLLEYAVKFPRIPPKYADTYELEKFKKNAMIIFNHETFLGSIKPRKGTMQDQKELEKTFGKFNFIIEPHLNLKKNILMLELKAFAANDFTDYGCICVTVMTHGSYGGRLRAYDRYFYEQDVIECFDVKQNRTLLGKPIIFLIQACRGDNPATAVNTDTVAEDQKFEYDNELHYDLPIQSNMIIFHSSWFGQASVRPIDGSWFIQILCKNINLLADTEDFQTICRMVQKEIALDKTFTTLDNVVAKQMPVFNSILIRRLFLRKYKGSDEVDHPDTTTTVARVEKTIATAALSMLPANTSVPCACDRKLQRMIRSLSIYTDDNPSDDAARYILENAKYVLTKDSTREKMFMLNLIKKYIGQHAVKKYMISEQSCRCSQEPAKWFGRVLSQVGPAVWSLATVTIVCVAFVKIAKL